MAGTPGVDLTDETGWPLHSARLREVAGIPARLPSPSFCMAPVMVGDTQVLVRRAPRLGRRQHRVMAICRICRELVPAGRLLQHRRSCR